MLLSFYKNRSRACGFTLIELMIVVAIVGILAAIAVPNFISYRNKSRVASAVGSLESLRAALAAYAADSPGNTFPASESLTYDVLVSDYANKNGATLKATMAEQGLEDFKYVGIDGGDGGNVDGIYEDYIITATVAGIPNTDIGRIIEVTPSGIEKKAGQ